MKHVLFAGCVILLLLGMAACTQSSTPAPDPAQAIENTTDDSENVTTESPENDTTEDLENDTLVDSENSDNLDEQTIGASVGKTIRQCELGDYPTSDDAPTLEQLSKYLEKTIAFQNAKIMGDAELWEFTDTQEYTILGRKELYTQIDLLFTYPVIQQGSDEIVNWSVNYKNGYVTSWNPEKDYSPEYVDTPVVFDTPEKALKYVKDHLAYTDQDLELVPGISGSEMTNNQYPAYRLKKFEDDVLQYSLNIDIDSAYGDCYYIHAYSFQVDYPDNGEGHTATMGWYSVFKNGFILNDLFSKSFIADEAL